MAPRIVENISGIRAAITLLSTDSINTRTNFLLLHRLEIRTIQSRDRQPQGSRSRKRRKPSGDWRLSRRTGPSGPDRRRNGQAASAVEVGSRGTFGGAGSREAGRGSSDTQAGGPAARKRTFGDADWQGRPQGRAHRSRPSGWRPPWEALRGRPQRRCQGALRSHAGTSASKHLAPSLRSGSKVTVSSSISIRQ